MDNVAAADVRGAVLQLRDAVLTLSACVLLASSPGAQHAEREAVDEATELLVSIYRDMRWLGLGEGGGKG
jgi:hypothetical protein